MTLSEIAAGIEVTAQQRDRGVAVADDTGTPLAERLRDHADELPCTAAATATLVDAYTAGRSVGDAADEAGVTPMTAAKTLHRSGVSGVCPLAPTRRGIVRDWLDGRIARTEAVGLVGGDDADFALATYVETHDPIPAVAEAVGANVSGTAPLGGDAGEDGALGEGALDAR
ncbi:hypothetical protein GRS48_01190 [Halorubrum sp. JWXQ-INN 858]|uniref:DUF7858 family protein n=1 Tax=Halorubrum sp. JWXQ-INN 858 TaxID=2690782 RepID=UPI00135A7683|nr:hypothetical protein [Halorubrum sp. JWXQ-INN 858]MWV63447.1 hypothetical protein [Halorubrum sp. JWXQ-INN 858]